MKKIKLLIANFSLLIALCACGFTPMYYGDNLSNKAHDIYVEPISGTNGIDMRNALRARFGTDNEKSSKYILTVNLAAPHTVYKAIQTTGDATWQEVRLTANYKLVDSENGETVISGSDQASESYTFVRDLVAATSSHNNAVQSAIRVLSDKIETRVNAKLASEK